MITHPGEHDTEEGAGVQEMGLALLELQLHRIQALETSGRSEIVAMAGSVLAADDAAIEYTPLSYQLQFLAASTHDHLSTLGRLLTGDEGGLPAMAGYTLIRTGVEASAYGIWLLAGGTKAKRVLRSLRLINHNRKDVESLAARLGTVDRETNVRVRERLVEIKNRIPKLRQNSIDEFPTTTAIITEADRSVPEGMFTGLQVWKACSGMAHANSGSAIGLLERRQVSAGDSVGATYYTTSSFGVVGAMFQVAVNYYEVLLDLAHSHGSTSPSGNHLE